MYYKLTFCVRNHLSCSSSRDSVSKIYIPTHPSRPSLCHSQFFAPWWKPTPRCLLHPAHWIRQMNIDFFSPSFTVSCVYFVPLLRQAVSHLHGLSAVDWANESVCTSLYCWGGGVVGRGTETVCSHIWTSRPQRPSDECRSLPTPRLAFFFSLLSSEFQVVATVTSLLLKTRELGEERWITEQSFLTTREMKWRAGFGGIGKKKRKRE